MTISFIGYSTQDTVVCYGDYAAYEVRTDTDTAQYSSVFTWDVEGGRIVDEYSNKVHVQWDKDVETGKLTVVETSIISGCEGQKKEYVVNISRPDVDLGFDREICLGDVAEFDTQEDYSEYEWPDGSDDETFTMDTSGNVWVKVKDEFGCEASDTAHLTVHELPEVNIKVSTDFPDRISMDDDSISFIAGEVNSVILDAGIWEWYEWNTGESMSTIEVDATDITSPEQNQNTRQYWVTVENEYGCRNTDSLAVTVLRKMEIPNAITPNGDGHNDRWEIPGLSLYPNAKVQIFDRWGDIVFESKGYDESKYWEGRDQRGRKLPMDSYYYIIDLGTGEKPLYGSVTIIR
ncbi:MAG: gliding motility-associated C-terminal domain-containing protein [Bacteroidales bacterium]